jgi:hypothetical protein
MINLTVLPLFSPLSIWSVLALIGASTGYVVKNVFTTKSNKLGLIGMEGSGKTTFFNNLRNIRCISESSKKEAYQRFSLKLKSGINICIEKAFDGEGAKSFIIEYRDIVFKNNVIIYFFDVNKYLTEIDYNRECNSRLDFIYPMINDQKQFIIVASHSDQNNAPIDLIKQKVLKEVSDKSFAKLFNKHFYTVNLSDKNEIESLLNKIMI